MPLWHLAVRRLLLLASGTGRTTQCEPSVGAGQGGITLRPTISLTASAGDMPAGDVVAVGNAIKGSRNTSGLFSFPARTCRGNREKCGSGLVEPQFKIGRLASKPVTVATSTDVLAGLFT